MPLPREQRADILAELRQDLESQIEDREAELGRTLTDAEIAEILKKRGHPAMVAGPYLPQHYLIGPVLYPLYVFVLRLVLLWTLIPVFVLTAPIIYATAGRAGPMLTELARLPTALFTAFGVITLIFIGIEKSRKPAMSALCGNWDPLTLPPVPAQGAKDCVTRTASIGEIVSGVYWTAMWLYLAAHGFSLDVASLHLNFPPIWREVFWPELILLLAGLALGAVVAFVPEQVRLYSITRIAIDCGGIIVAAVLFFPGAVVISGPKFSAETLAHAQYGVNLGLRISWVAIAVLLLIDMLMQIARLRRGRSRGTWELRRRFSVRP